MGGCATKPGVVIEQGGEAPPPLEKPGDVDVSESKVEGEKDEEGKRTSLGTLFRESEKRREVSENEETTVKETITASQEESKGDEEEQTKAQVHHAPDSETTSQTVEPEEISAPTHEETHTLSSVPTSIAQVAEENLVEVENVKEIVEDSSSDQKAEVVKEKEDAKLELSSTTVKEDDAALPSSIIEKEYAALPTLTTEKGEDAALPSSITEKEEDTALPTLRTEKEEEEDALPILTTEKEEEDAALPSSTTDTA